jgi:hypothetical protein
LTSPGPRLGFIKKRLRPSENGFGQLPVEEWLVCPIVGVLTIGVAKMFYPNGFVVFGMTFAHLPV